MVMALQSRGFFHTCFEPQITPLFHRLKPDSDNHMKMWLVEGKLDLIDWVNLSFHNLEILIY